MDPVKLKESRTRKIMPEHLAKSSLCKDFNDIKFLINTGYSLLLFPFHVGGSGGSQRVICAILHGCTFLTSASSLTAVFGQGTLRGNPATVFLIAMNIAAVGLLTSVIHIIWSGKGVIHRIYTNPGDINCDCGKQGILARALWKIYIVGNILAPTTAICYPEEGLVTHIGQSMLGCAENATVLGIMTGFGNALLTVVCFYVHRVAKRLQMSTNPRNQLQEFKQVKLRIGFLNELVSPFVLSMIVTWVIYISFMVSGIPGWHPIREGVHMGVLFGCFVYLLLAAETHYKMNEVEQSILHTFRSVGGADVAVELANSPGRMGLSGWKFFTVSYPLLGSILTTTFTYALVSLQFSTVLTATFTYALVPLQFAIS